MIEFSNYIYTLHYENYNLSSLCNGLRHCIEIGYYLSGSIQWLKHWRNGVRHGIEIWYRLNGLIMGFDN